MRDLEPQTSVGNQFNVRVIMQNRYEAATRLQYQRQFILTPQKFHMNLGLKRLIMQQLNRYIRVYAI